MKFWNRLVILACLLGPGAGSLAVAADKAEKKPSTILTCCEEAIAKDKECKHRCCMTAHRKGESCEKCNPNKEDLKAMKKKAEAKGKKAPVKAQKTAATDSKPADKAPKAEVKAQKS